MITGILLREYILPGKQHLTEDVGRGNPIIIYGPVGTGLNSTSVWVNPLIIDVLVMDAAVVQVSKPVRNSRHYDSAPVQPLHI